MAVNKWCLALLALVAAGSVQAQTRNAQEVIGSNLAMPFTMRTVNFNEIGLAGSPYVLPGWVPGEVTLGSGKQLTTALVNYDAFERHVTVKNSPTDSVRYEGRLVQQLVLRPPGNVPALRFGHLPGLKTDVPALKTELLRIIHAGTYALIELPARRFVPASKMQPASNYAGPTALNDEFRDESAYYLIRPDKTAERVKLTRKALITALQDKGEAFDTYLKTNRLDVKSEVDLARGLASLDVPK